MTKNLISAKIIADSKNEFGNRITTYVLTYPRIIHAEIMTHRMFSRNAASSRAVPFDKLVKAITDEPFIPIAWQKDHKGMQGTEYITDPETIDSCIEAWLEARDYAVHKASQLNKDGEVTKQLVNRLLEPFQYYTCIVTATEFENFFALRCPSYEYQNVHSKVITFRSKKDLFKLYAQEEGPQVASEALDSMTDLDWLKTNKGMAEIHLMALAEAMWDAYNESIPKELKAGEWHIPFGDNISSYHLAEFVELAKTNKAEEIRIKIATARCARVSYTVIGEEGKEHKYEDDIKLHDRLAASGHWSCFEHCARAMNTNEYNTNINGEIADDSKYDIQDIVIPIYVKGWSGNFKGFLQYRKMFSNENIK